MFPGYEAEPSSRHLIDWVPYEFSPDLIQKAKASLALRRRFLQSPSACWCQTKTPSRLAATGACASNDLRYFDFKSLEGHVDGPEVDVLAQVELGEFPSNRQPVSLRLEGENGNQYVLFKQSNRVVLRMVETYQVNVNKKRARFLRLVSGGRDTFLFQAALISDKRATFMSASELFLADVRRSCHDAT